MSKADLRVDWCTHEAAKYACEHWHYSKSIPVPPLTKIGVWENGKYIGVVIFSRGASPSLLSPYGLKQNEGCELTRVALCNHKTTVSRIIRLSVAFLKSTNQGLRLIVSFADPQYSHHGGIYQAGNWLYIGDTQPGVEYWFNGRRLHSRQVSAKGWNIQQGQQRKTIKPNQCKIIKTKGKHRYLMPLDAEMRAQVLPLAKPYPKRPKKPDDPDQGNRGRGSTDPDAPNTEASG